MSVADRSSQDSRSTVEAATVIDASGQAGFLAKRLGMRQVDPELRNVAVYAHYRGIPRPAGPQRGNIRVVSRFDLGWVWSMKAFARSGDCWFQPCSQPASARSMR